mgnify:CR=1 FL=1
MFVPYAVTFTKEKIPRKNALNAAYPAANSKSKKAE